MEILYSLKQTTVIINNIDARKYAKQRRRLKLKQISTTLLLEYVVYFAKYAAVETDITQRADYTTEQDK